MKKCYCCIRRACLTCEIKHMVQNTLEAVEIYERLVGVPEPPPLPTYQQTTLDRFVKRRRHV